MNIHEYQAKAVLRDFGVPVVIGAGGVERIVEIELDREEKAAFDKSAAAVHELIEVVKGMKILG